MPDTPLNPDALEAAASVLCDETAGQHTRYADLKTGLAKKLWGRRAEHVVSAYLAVAQPVVTSVEELEALPIGSAIIDKHGDVGLIDCYGTKEKYVQFAQTVAMSIEYTAKHFLPARVLYRPEVNNA